MRWLADTAMEMIDDTLGVFVDADQRVYWPCLLGSLALAVLVARYSEGRRDALRHLASPRIWWHRSSRLDYQFLFANGALRILLIAPLGMSALSVAVGTVDLLDAWRGVPAASSWSGLAIGGLYTLVLFLSWDLSRYVLHRLAHEVPFLWELHKVHHSAEVMTPLTLFRVHPLERFLFAARGVLVTGVVTGVFFHLFRERAVQYELLGINALGFAFNLAGANLRHSHVWLSYGRVLEHIFISPAQHQIHHSDRPEHYSANYGTWLAIWDWLGGSLYITSRERERLRFGLTEADLNHDPHGLVSSILSPLATAPAKLVPPRPSSQATSINRDPGAPG